MKKKNREEESKAGVEELLQAAADEMLLNLSVDSHISRSSYQSDSIPSDLDRRFQALKSHPSTSNNNNNIPQSRSLSSHDAVSTAADGVLADDLSARFAALKPKFSSSYPCDSARKGVYGVDYDDEEDEDDQVEKLIRWAKDAARLDPSPPSDDDVVDSDEDLDDDDDDSDVDRRQENKKNKTTKSSNSK